MAVREFDAVDDDIVTATGALSGMTHGTVAIIVKLAAAGDSTFRALFYTHDSTPTLIGAVLVWSNNDWNWRTAGAGSDGPVAATDVWYLMVVRKDSGIQFPRFSVFNYTTATWEHAQGDHEEANWATAGVSGQIRFSNAGGSDFTTGRVAVRGAWSNSLPWSADAAGDTAIEAAGLETALENWVTASPSALWPLNQASVSTAVEDITGGGADQTARTGTSVITDDDPPGFSFALGGLHLGQATAPLGPLGATATGQVTVSGSASASMGITAAASGQRSVPGVATANLGALTASAAGINFTGGVASADLGALIGIATGVVVRAGTALADLGGLTATARAKTTIMGTALAELGDLFATAAGEPVSGPRFFLRGPTYDENLWTNDRLFIRYSLPRGITLAVLGTTVQELIYPFQEDLEQYDVVYLGGMDHRLTSAEASLLIDAGYGDFIFPIEE